MNENQMNFLNELDKLFAKYSINRVHTTQEDGGIIFESHGQSLIVMEYDDGVFNGISAIIEEYKPPA